LCLHCGNDKAERLLADAETANTEALAIRRDLAQRDPGAYRPDVAATLNNLAVLYRDTGRLADAETANTEALAIRRDLAQRDPGAYRPDVAQTLNNLAVLYRDTGRLADAETAYTEALASDVSPPLGHVKAKLITEREFQHAFLELLCGRAKSSSLPEMWFIDCTGQCNFTRVGCGAS
jgi:tetratricopeptide (TPR) repeat protein